MVLKTNVTLPIIQYVLHKKCDSSKNHILDSLKPHEANVIENMKGNEIFWQTKKKNDL